MEILDYHKTHERWQRYGEEYPKEIHEGLNVKYQSGNKLTIFQFIFLGLGFICLALYFVLLLF